MERSEVKEVLLRVAKQKYDMDLSGFDEHAPLSELQAMNPKIDSLAVIEMIFDIEDELDVNYNDNDMTQPSNLAEIIDALTQAANMKNES